MADSVYDIADRIVLGVVGDGVEVFQGPFKIHGTDDVGVNLFTYDGRLFHIKVHEER